MVKNNRGAISEAETNYLREAIEVVFTQHCGVIANVLIPRVRSSWEAQYEPRLATLKKYIDALSLLIPDREVRKQFESDASRRMINRDY